VLPLSLLSFNAGLLLGLFFFILLGLLLGLTLLSLNFQHLMEKLMTHLFLFWTNTSFKDLILKNLVAHKMRNRQTAIMYSLALGFVIFIVVALNQVLNNLSYQIQARRGAYISIIGKDGSMLDYHSNLENLIETQLSDIVESYAFMTSDLRAFLTDRGYEDVTITHLGRLYEIQPKIRGISPTTFKTTINKYLQIDEQDKNTGLDLAEQLYTPRGSQGMIIGKSYQEQLGLSLDLDSPIIVSMADGTATRTEQLRPLAFVNSAPGFTFSNIPSVDFQDVLVSLPTYMRLVGDRVANYAQIPIDKLMIKVKGDSKELRARVVDKFNQLGSDNNYNMRVWDFSTTEKTLESNQSTLTLVFNFVEILVMILTMFSLITSMTTNILEQTKEIAVLRAVGMTKFKVNMLYVSEAFILVMASAFFGIIIGTVVAWTLSIQQVLFTQLPLMFSFPFRDLIVIFIAAVLSAFISAFFPARRITKFHISKIIRL